MDAVESLARWCFVLVELHTAEAFGLVRDDLHTAEALVLALDDLHTAEEAAGLDAAVVQRWRTHPGRQNASTHSSNSLAEPAPVAAAAVKPTETQQPATELAVVAAAATTHSASAHSDSESEPVRSSYSDTALAVAAVVHSPLPWQQQIEQPPSAATFATL